MATKKPKAVPARSRPAVKSAKKSSVKKPPTRRATKVNPPTPPRIGEQWPGQGGRYLGIIRGESGQPDYHLIAPDHSADSMQRGRPWGPPGKVVGALSHCDGLANTKAMVKAGSALAEKVRALSIERHKDYYIGARDEARLAYINAREHFQKDGWFWTSTQDEFVDAYAWMQTFGTGGQLTGHESDESRAFVVRRIPIQ